MGPLGHSLAALSALVAAPLFGAALLLRPAWRAGWRERLGATSATGPASVWIHAASLGETRAALPLAQAFAAAGEALYLSHTRADALGLAFPLGEPSAALVGRGVAPLDHPWCAGRTLDAIRPRAIVLVETELWPNGIRAAVERGIAVGVASASISDRSFERYRRFGRFTAPTFERLSFVGAQSDEDADRFLALGTLPERVAVTGDLKRDEIASIASTRREPAPPELVASLAGRTVFVAGSTHEGEERIVLEAYEKARLQHPELACVIAPRRLERVPEVCALAREFGLEVRLRSAGDASPLASRELLILDTFGELAACYSVASVAFVGGSLVPLGGHNLYEATGAGAFVLHGPHVESAAAAARELGAAGRARCVRSVAELADSVVAAIRSAGEARADSGSPVPSAAQQTASFIAQMWGDPS